MAWRQATSRTIRESQGEGLASRVLAGDYLYIQSSLSSSVITMCCAFCYHDFDHLVPLLGRLGIEQDGPYSYLPNSLKDFPHQEEVRRLFAEAGLRDARYIELTGGIVAVHVGSKQNESRVNGRGIA